MYPEECGPQIQQDGGCDRDLKHSLIDPQGDFVKLTSVDTDAKTVVISDEELGEIKHTPKQSIKADIEALEKELNETNYDDYDPDEDEDRTSRSRSRSSRDRDRERDRERDRDDRERRLKKKKRGVSVAGSIVALIAGAAVLIAVIVVAGKATGLIGGGKANTEADQQEQTTQQDNTDDGLVPVPDLVGKTEAEAQELLASLNIGMSYKGEEASTQAKGNISSQDPVEGTRVEKNSTVNYYVSKGSEEITVPDLFGQNAAAAQETLESQGVNVQINKIYPDDTSSVDIGCVLDTEPTAGTTVKAGGTVTLTISRGIDYGDSVQVPDVTGLEKMKQLPSLANSLISMWRHR